MQAEEAVNPQSRYILVDFFLSDRAIAQLKQKVATRNIKKIWLNAYKQFMDWQRQENEWVVFTLYAYADLTIPKRYEVIFQVDQPDYYVEIEYQVTQSIYEGWVPIPMIEHGHKHVLVLTFQEKIPTILTLLPDEISHNQSLQTRLGFCTKSDFAAITERRKKVLKLQALYGTDWWQYDQESD